MPANKKYLMTSGWSKASKFIASIIGGFVATFSLHFTLALFMDRTVLLSTSIFSVFIVWVLFMLWIYKMKRNWHVWTMIAIFTAFGALSVSFLN